MIKSIDSVCMFTNLYPPVVSGSSTQSSFLAREFAKQGKNVSVVTASLNPKDSFYEMVEGVHVYRIPCLKLPRIEIALNFPWLNMAYLPGNRERITKIIKKHRPDVLHLHNHMFDLAFAAVAMRQRFRIPLVVTIHTMIKHADNFYNLILYPLDRLFLKNAVIKNSDIIISPDHNILDYAKSAFGSGNIHRRVPYGIKPPADPIRKNVEKLRERYSLDGKCVIISIGHVHKIRDRRELVEAMPLVLRRIPNVVLMIIGAVTTDIPSKTAKKLGVDKNIVFTGPVPHEMIGNFLALADIEAHWLNQDSPARTSLGVASLECMGAGKVVMSIANEETYGSGVLKNGENVILVKSGNPSYLADSIVDILRDDERRRQIGMQAQKTIKENFSWERICADTDAVYMEAVRRYGSA